MSRAIVWCFTTALRTPRSSNGPGTTMSNHRACGSSKNPEMYRRLIGRGRTGTPMPGDRSVAVGIDRDHFSVGGNSHNRLTGVEPLSGELVTDDRSPLGNRHDRLGFE